jgi:O-antigen/teichoic acid export membrane protein
LSATINLINKDSELLWVAYFRNPTETGYYKLAMTLLNMVQMPVNPMVSTTYSELSREVANKRWQNVKKLLYQGSLVAGGYTLLASLFLLVFGQSFINIAYSAQYLPTYPALIILLIGVLVANTFYWRRPVLLALGLPDHLTKVSFGAAVLKILGYFYFVPSWGYLGCAVLLSGYNIFTSLVNTSKAVITLRHREAAVELTAIP